MEKTHPSNEKQRGLVASVAGWAGKIARGDKVVDGYTIPKGVTICSAEGSTARAFSSPWPEWPDPSPGSSSEPFSLTEEDFARLEQDSQATR